MCKNIGLLYSFEAQDEVCGEEAFADAMMELRIVKPNMPDLSLVDLPGIARMIKEGNPGGMDVAQVVFIYI